MALAVEWLPEEWPDGTPGVKQQLVGALLTTSILLLLETEITAFAGCGREGRDREQNSCTRSADGRMSRRETQAAGGALQGLSGKTSPAATAREGIRQTGVDS